jgi:uncharacterized membrane protein YdjX (TVP38/TMEM64 family)
METTPKDRSPTRRARLRAVVLLAGAAVVLLGLRFLPAGEAIAALADRARATGAAGMAAFGAAYVAAELLALPLAPFSLGAGWAFGALLGAAVTVPATTVGATVAFALTRFLVRERGRLASGDGRLSRALRGAGEGGFHLVLLLRLSPLTPFSVLNFAFGATPMRARDFALATFLGTIPSALAYAFLGSLLSRPGDAPPGGAWFLGTAVAVTLVVAWRLRGRLASGGPEECDPQPG